MTPRIWVIGTREGGGVSLSPCGPLNVPSRIPPAPESSQPRNRTRVSDSPSAFGVQCKIESQLEVVLQVPREGGWLKTVTHTVGKPWSFHSEHW